MQRQVDASINLLQFFVIWWYIALLEQIRLLAIVT